MADILFNLHSTSYDQGDILMVFTDAMIAQEWERLKKVKDPLYKYFDEADPNHSYFPFVTDDIYKKAQKAGISCKPSLELKKFGLTKGVNVDRQLEQPLYEEASYDKSTDKWLFANGDEVTFSAIIRNPLTDKTDIITDLDTLPKGWELQQVLPLVNGKEINFNSANIPIRQAKKRKHKVDIDSVFTGTTKSDLFNQTKETDFRKTIAVTSVSIIEK